MSEPLTNCHTCGWDKPTQCGAPPGTRWVHHWRRSHPSDAQGMPPHAATGCPGWKPRPAGIPSHDIPGHRPDNDRQQLAALGTVKDSLMVDHTSGEWMQVRRAAWDATLATIARLESRVESLESRADETARLARGVGPRVAALFRRDRLRGGR